MSEVIIRPAQASDAGWIVAQHGLLYGRDEGFDETFAPLVAQILAGFFADHDATCEAGWIAEVGGAPVGCIFCVRLDGSTAKLRLFLTLPEVRGVGLGRRLLETCVGFARAAGYSEMTLWTHESHQAACALYARTGWQMVAETPVHSFGCDLVEQTWVKTL